MLPRASISAAAARLKRTTATLTTPKYRTQSLTLGSNQALTPRLTNEFRFNYSRSRASGFVTADNFGGATPPTQADLYPSFAPPQNSGFEFFGDLNPYGLRFITGNQGDNLQQQINVTDNVSHVDWRAPVEVRAGLPPSQSGSRTRILPGRI